MAYFKNQIVNYYITDVYENGMPKVFRSPVTMPHEVARELLEKQMALAQQQVKGRKLLHVSYDVDSGTIYVPNASEFTPEKRRLLLQAANISIAKDFGSTVSKKPIDGSPFSTIRVRSISSFELLHKELKDNFGDNFNDLKVVEVNLDKMPSLAKAMPSYYAHKRFEGEYVSPSRFRSVTFMDEIDNSGKRRNPPVELVTLNAPFILINIAAGAQVSASGKERVVSLGFRDFIHDKSIIHNSPDKVELHKSSSQADIYAVKRFLYMGYPFEEVCEVFLPRTSNFGDLYGYIKRFMQASEELVSEGHKSPTQIPYYITFEIDKGTFPIDIESMADSGGKINPSKQLPYFKIVEFDRTNNYVTIETPAFLNESLCRSTLKAKSLPLITQYNSSTKKIDVKSSDVSFSTAKSNTNQVNKIHALTSWKLDKLGIPSEQLKFQSDDRTRSVSKSTTAVCHMRMVSDYLYAYEHIKKMCEKRGVEFIDLPVIVGPIDRIFGQGTQGGFMSLENYKESMKKNKNLKIPMELERGLFVSPPFILINAASMTGYEAQTETIIHEYSHCLYSIANPGTKAAYNEPENIKLKEKEHTKDQWWWLYLNDPDEIKAHTEQIEFELKSGKSRDEIIRDKVGGKVDTKNYGIALHYGKMVDGIIAKMGNEEAQDKPQKLEAIGPKKNV